MSYLERKQAKGKSYLYFVKKLSFMGETYVIKKYVGVESASISKEKYILDNIDEISEEEASFRKKFLENVEESLSYDKNLPKKIEIKSIRINNLEEGKQCGQSLHTEFAKEFIFNSNNLEGSKIPPERVREIIDTGDTKYADRNEIKEVQNSILAFRYLEESFKFNLSSLKRLYHILTKNLFKEGNVPYPKGFKKESNIIGNSQTTSPEDVEKELNALIKWYHENKNKLHPLILAFEFHRKYEFIHPFLDGNGRTGRLIMNKILMTNKYSQIIVYKDNKQAYFSALEKSKSKNPKNYYQFMLEQADKSYDYLLEILKKY